MTSVVIAFACRATTPTEGQGGVIVHEIKVTPRFFIRDLIFYAVTSLYLLVVLLFVGYFDLWLSAFMIAIYAAYVATVIIQSKRDAAQEAQEE